MWSSAIYDHLVLLAQSYLTVLADQLLVLGIDVHKPAEIIKDLIVVFNQCFSTLLQVLRDAPLVDHLLS